MTVHEGESLIPIHQAQQLVLDSCPVLAPQSTDIEGALGRICAQDVFATEDIPPFDNSAVDGYALRADDTVGARPEAPVVVDVIGEVAAGSAHSGAVAPGQAVRIMTGAPIPEGADGVVMVEFTAPADASRESSTSTLERVAIGTEIAARAAIRSVGDDVRAGDLVFTAGTLVSPMVAGVLASLNCRAPLVHPAPRVAVLSTGDELVDDGSPLRAGQIRESNRMMLLGLVERSGAIPIDHGIVRDDEAVLTSVLRRAASQCDVIITSGGVSMGDYDVVKAVLGEIADMRWMQIAIKPAKPFAFGILHHEGRAVPVLGLPGNPVSSMVSFELLARPALRKMAGFGPDQLYRPVVHAIADGDLRRSSDGKIHYQRVVTHWGPDGRVHVSSVRAQGSHQLAASALADGLAILPDGDGVGAGQDVDVVLLVS